MQSMKLMFLGFLVILVGIGWFIALGTALPGNGTRTINPFVQLFSNTNFYATPSDENATGPDQPSLDDNLVIAVQTQEFFACLVVLGGLGLGIAGYFRQERQPVPPRPEQPSGKSD